MVWIVIPLVGIVLIVVYLVTAPFVVEIDSVRELYQLRMHRLASARLHLRESSLMLNMNIAGWKKEVDLLQQKQKGKMDSAETTRKRTEKSRKRKSKMSMKKIWAVLRTFRVRTFFVNVDTGDMPTNGILFPVLYGLSVWSRREFHINFVNQNVIRLEVRNSVARVLWAYLKT